MKCLMGECKFIHYHCHIIRHVIYSNLTPTFTIHTGSSLGVNEKSLCPIVTKARAVYWDDRCRFCRSGNLFSYPMTGGPSTRTRSSVYELFLPRHGKWERLAGIKGGFLETGTGTSRQMSPGRATSCFVQHGLVTNEGKSEDCANKGVRVFL